MTTYRFTISESYTPDEIPMARLAEYLDQISRLLGERENVHLRTIEGGSTSIVALVDLPAVPKVRARISEAGTIGAKPDIMRPYKRLNDLLRNDNAVATLKEEDKVVAQFGGRNDPTRIGPVVEDSEFVGVLVRIGGVGEDVVHATFEISELSIPPCELKKNLAKSLAQYLYGPQLRIYGRQWSFRLPEGGWEVDRFTIVDFELLHEETLIQTVHKLQNAEGSEWSAIEDPFNELGRIRYGEEPEP